MNNYVTGTDAHIFLNQEQELNCTQFNFTTSSQAMPVYGYKSKYYDTLVKGIINARGYFSINTNNKDEAFNDHINLKKELYNSEDESLLFNDFYIKYLQRWYVIKKCTVQSVENQLDPNI